MERRNDGLLVVFVVDRGDGATVFVVKRWWSRHGRPRVTMAVCRSWGQVMRLMVRGVPWRVRVRVV